MDVKSYFLNGVIFDEVHVKQPLGFKDSVHPNHVFKLQKSLDGLNQALRTSYERLSNFLLENGFKKGQVNTTLFRKILKNDILIVQVFVVDIIFGSTNAFLCKYFLKSMQTEFEMSMIGELKFILGILINKCKDGFYVRHIKYTNELLKKFKLDDCKIMTNLMHPTCNISKEESSIKVCQKMYRGMIGSLLYLIAFRPYILFNVWLCARFRSDHRKTHLTVVDRIFRYLKGTTNLGFLYKTISNYKLVGFCDANYARD